MNDSPSLPTGADAPDPPPEERAAPTFDALPLSSELRATLAEMGYVNPTPVQLAVWEPATRGKDAVVQARTGTGKTAAFGMPIVDHLVKRSVDHVQALCLCPTRELALQVAAELERLGKRKAVRVVAVYGGAPMPKQVEQIANGAQIVVGTPGRVLDHLRRGTLDPKGIRILVLDESDEMLSMGFERELTAILDHLPPERQTLLFSATLPPDIERIARNKLKQPEFVTLSGDHVGALSIQHFVYMVAADKLSALVRIIEVENPEGAVVFCNTKDETERVAQALTKQGYDADWLNGDLPQSEREKVMSATREGRLRFLVATDVAARGIDVSHLTHVINHDFPQDAESYVHRTGRTGRAGRTGQAISLITPRDIGGLYLLRLTYKIRPIEKQIPSAGELKTRAEADLVSMLAEAFLAKRPHPDDIALAKRLLTHDRCDAIVAGLLRDHLGARPTAQDEASAARRARPPRRAPLREARVAAERARPLPAITPAVVVPAPIAATPIVSIPRAATPIAPVALAPRPLDETAAASSDAVVSTERAVVARDGDTRLERRPNRPRPLRDEASADSQEGRPREDSRRARNDKRPPDSGTNRAAPAIPRPSGPRHADFATWQPPEEEGDDQPILRGDRAGLRRPTESRPIESRPIESRPIESEPAAPAVAEGDFVEIFVNVGRRDGARAGDLQRALFERASMDREAVGRIRVRERNAFVSVKKTDLERALAALTGLSLGGKSTLAEQARDRAGASTEDEAV